jgi:hypothetical protein
VGGQGIPALTQKAQWNRFSQVAGADWQILGTDAFGLGEINTKLKNSWVKSL